jgi:TonB family protein
MRALLVSITLLLAVGAQPDEAEYLTMIQQKVSQVAPKTREKHNVTVVVDIESSGHLSALRVTKSSGDPRVDESVLRAVLASSPFKPSEGVGSPTHRCGDQSPTLIDQRSG